MIHNETIGKDDMLWTDAIAIGLQGSNVWRTLKFGMLIDEIDKK